MYAIAAYGVQCLAAGCRGQVQGSRVCVQEEGCCTSHFRCLHRNHAIHELEVEHIHTTECSEGGHYVTNSVNTWLGLCTFC